MEGKRIPSVLDSIPTILGSWNPEVDMINEDLKKVNADLTVEPTLRQIPAIDMVSRTCVWTTFPLVHDGKQTRSKD